MEPKISVVMSVYNESSRELSDSINSILNQTYKNYEFIIVDDNPVSLRIRDFLLNMNNNIHLLFNKRNLGAALSRNRGIQHATGDYIAIMDADDVASKHRLSCQISFLRKNSLDFVFPNYQIISFNGSMINNHVYNFSNIVNQHEINYILGHIQNISINSGWLVNKSIFITLHGYRNCIIEDYDFIARALIKGFKLGYQSKVLMQVRYHSSSRMRSNSLRTYLVTKNISKGLNNKCIQSINNIDFLYKNNNITHKDIRNFNNWIISCHNIKYRHTILNFLKFIYFLCITKYSVNSLINKILSIIQLKLYTKNNKR